MLFEFLWGLVAVLDPHLPADWDPRVSKFLTKSIFYHTDAPCWGLEIIEKTLNHKARILIIFDHSKWLHTRSKSLKSLFKSSINHSLTERCLKGSYRTSKGGIMSVASGDSPTTDRPILLAKVPYQSTCKCRRLPPPNHQSKLPFKTRPVQHVWPII